VNGNSSSQLGGGVYQGNNFNCLITGNKSSIGGGAYQSTNYNCIITGNTAGQGGGLYLATIINCTVASNSASIGGGIYAGIAFNSIIDFNSASGGGANWTNSPYFYHCCTTPQPNVYAGNITNDPLFVDVAGGDLRLKCGSPCIDTGSANYFSPIGILTAPANDFRDVPRPLDGDGDGITQFDMGAYEYNPAIDQIPVIRAAFTFAGFATHYAVPFIGEIGGCADYFWWDFGDGTTVTNQSNVSHAWSSSGTYSVVLTAYYSSLGHGLSATAQVQVVQPPIYYASVSSPIPTPPYTNWLTAAHTIQQAIAAGTTPGRLVLVTNGLYQTPGVIVYGATYNNLALTDPVVVQSVNGPGVTTVSPFQGRCAYVGNNAILSGFTLAGGHVLSSSGDISQEQSGGGVWCEPGGVVSNCVIAGNLANYYGGGAYQGTFYNCVMTNNSVGFNGANAAQGNGVFGGTLHDCTVIGNTSFGTTTGGGASQSTLYDCLLTGNSATWGGGANLSTLYSCTVSGNRSAINGGGAYSNTLWNCVLAGNTANNGGGAYASTLHNCLVISNQAFNTGGGLYSGALFNCTVANNTAATGGGIYGTIPSPVDNSILFDNTAWSSGNNWQGSLIGSNNCTFPLLPPTAWGNITNDPVFADAAYHLSANSPCRGTGSSFCAIGTDLDGEPWNSPPSMGADEVYDADFAGSLAVAIQSSQTTLLVNRSLALTGQITGRAAELAWSFGDGTFVTNVSFFTSHLWTGPGDYNVVFTAYNPDNPGGISTNLPVHVLPLDPPLLQSTSLLALSNGFQFQFDGQSNAIYTVQMTTNLAPPVVWADLQTITSTGGVVQIMDANATNATSFYRVGVQ
jgi:PKD repeat protein